MILYTLERRIFLLLWEHRGWETLLSQKGKDLSPYFTGDYMNHILKSKTLKVKTLEFLMSFPSQPQHSRIYRLFNSTLKIKQKWSGLGKVNATFIVLSFPRVAQGNLICPFREGPFPQLPWAITFSISLFLPSRSSLEELDSKLVSLLSVLECCQ